MNDLVINGRVFSVESNEFDQLTILGEDAIEFVSKIVSGDGLAVVSKPGYKAQNKFAKVVLVDRRKGKESITVESLTIRGL